MVTGSVAMNYYAQPRMTRDIDVVMDVRASDVEKLMKLLRPDCDHNYLRSRAKTLGVEQLLEELLDE